MSLAGRVGARLGTRIGTRVWLRLIALLGGTLIAVSSVLMVLVLVFYHDRLSDAQDRAAAQLGGLLHAALENAMLKRDIPGMTAILNDLADQPDIRAVMVLNPAGQVRFASDPALTGAPPPPAAPGISRSERRVANRAECSACHGPVAQNPVNGTLVVDHDTRYLARDTLASAAGLMALGALATLAASVALAWGLRRIVVRPVAALARAADALAAGDLSARVAPQGRDEIAALGRGFNTMADHIEQAQAALMRADRLSQALIDAIPDGIRVIGPDFRIRRANAAYADQVGRPLAEIIGQPCYASTHGRDAPCPYTLTTCPVAVMREAPRRVTFRDRHRAPAGRQISVEVSAAPMEDCVVEAIRNLDEQVQMSQSQRLSELGLLATGVAHEIHNPLGSIALALEAIGAELARGDTGRAQDYLALIQSEIGKCLDITDSLLRLGAPPGDQRQLLGLRDTVAGVMQLLGWLAAEQGVDVQIEIAPDLRVLMADSDLRMAVTNLALNAFHAMPGGGRLVLRGARAQGCISLAITDTGVGIAPADLHDIFMPFWSRRADDSTGRGLGLAITRAIAERAHARIGVDSAPGRGSTFTLTFPDPDNSP